MQTFHPELLNDTNDTWHSWPLNIFFKKDGNLFEDRNVNAVTLQHQREVDARRRARQADTALRQREPRAYQPKPCTRQPNTDIHFF